MDITQYRNFITVVESGTITAPAKKLNIAQPALSSHIKNLENEFGAEFLEKSRGQRSVRLTGAGQLFYRQAKAICLLHDNLHRDIADYKIGVSGTLKISISPSRSSTLIQNFVRQFHKDYPGVKYVFYEGSVYEQEQQILAGITEFAVANAPLGRPHLFDILFQRRQQLYAVFNKACGWFKEEKESLGLKDLEGIPLCLSGSLPLLEHCMKQEKLKQEILFESTTRGTALYTAQAGLGVAVVPFEKYDEIPYDNLTFAPVKHEGLFTYKTIFKLKGHELSAVANHFLEYYSVNCYPDTEKFYKISV